MTEHSPLISDEEIKARIDDYWDLYWELWDADVIDTPDYESGWDYWTLEAQRDASDAYWKDRISGVVKRPKNFPEIVCLCGSTRFVDTFNEWRKLLTYEGKIVLSIEIVTTQSKQTDPQHANQELKTMLDELHKRKIDLADRVMILNVGGYIGESTRDEITYALKIGKPISYLEVLTKEEG